MKHSVFLFLTVFSLLGAATQQCNAQSSKFTKSAEVGFGIGTSYYLGEINPYQHFGGTLNLGGGLILKYNFNKRLSLRGTVFYSQLEAYDADSDLQWQQERGLHFRNNLFETTAGLELNFWDYQPSNKNYPFSPYLFMAVGMYTMNPQADYLGDWYSLQPLGTEGQGTSEGEDRYSNRGLVIPFGVGLKANVGGRLSLGIEWGMRKTYTDYVDDVSGTYIDPNVLLVENGQLAVNLADQTITPVSYNQTNAMVQRGDPSKNDWYSLINFNVLIRIDKKATTCWK